MGPNDEKVFEFLPLSLRLETLGGVATPLVLRGTPLPTRRTHQFSTAEDDQSKVEVSLWIGESSLTQHNVRVGDLMLDGIPPGKAGEPAIIVEFSVDKHCRIKARASIRGTDLAAEQTFSPPFDLTDEAIQRSLQDAEAKRQTDDHKLREIESINRAKAVLRKAENRLEDAEHSDISEGVANLGLAIASRDVDKIHDRTEALEQLLAGTVDPLWNEILGSAFMFPYSTKGKAGPKRSKAPTTPAHQDIAVSGNLARPLGKVFGGGSYTLDPQLCFVLMPFTDQLQPLYEDHIKPVVVKAGMRCERADELVGPTLITQDIWEYISRSRFLIAELTDRNPNVFYELGLAHALSKDLILLTQTMGSVPFDLKTLRCVKYDFTPRGVAKLEAALVATVDALVKAG